MSKLDKETLDRLIENLAGLNTLHDEQVKTLNKMILGVRQRQESIQKQLAFARKGDLTSLKRFSESEWGFKDDSSSDSST